MGLQEMGILGKRGVQGSWEGQADATRLGSGVPLC